MALSTLNPQPQHMCLDSRPKDGLSPLAILAISGGNRCGWMGGGRWRYEQQCLLRMWVRKLTGCWLRGWLLPRDDAGRDPNFEQEHK
jgi:hypothetical protein